MEGDPRYEASQSIPDFPYARYAEMIGLRGVRVDDPDRVGEAWDEVLGVRPARRARGDRRSRDPAAAAAHHVRAGEALRPGGAPRRREPAGRWSATRSARCSTRSRPDGDRDRRARRSARPAGRGGLGRRLHDPDRPARVGRHLRLGLDDDRRRRGRRPADEAGIGWTYAPAAVAGPDRGLLAPAVEGTNALDTGAAHRAMRTALRNTGEAGAGGMALSAVDVALWDLKAKLLELPLASLLGRGARGGAGVRQRRLLLLLARASCASSWAAGSPTGSRG